MTVIDAPPQQPEQPQSPPLPPPPPSSGRARRWGPGWSARWLRPSAAGPEPAGWQALRASLVTLSVLLAWFVTYALLLTPLQNHHDQGVLYSQFRQQLAEETAPLGGVIGKGSPVAIMDAPAAGIRREVVVEGTTSSNLTEGPGHERDTVLPGQPGVSTIMGRGRLFGAPFRSIASLPVGATITFTTGEGVATYKVLDVRRAGDAGPAPLASGVGGLLLITSDSSGWRSGWAPSSSVYVDAALTSTPFGTVPGGLADAQGCVRTGQLEPDSLKGAPACLPSAETPMQGDSSSLYVLVLLLPLLLGALLAVAWAFARWGRWQAWFCGVPLLLAAAWAISKVAVQLLPNLM